MKNCSKHIQSVHLFVTFNTENVLLKLRLMIHIKIISSVSHFKKHKTQTKNVKILDDAENMLYISASFLYILK